MENKYINKSILTLGAFALSAMAFVGCSDDDLSKSVADYDPYYKGNVEFPEADYVVDAETTTQNISFTVDQAWTATIYDEAEGEGNCSWATISPESGEAGENVTITVTMQPNEDSENSRTAKIQVVTEKGTAATVTIMQNYKVLWLDPADIADYDKYTCPGEWNPHFEEGPEYMLRHDSYYSWHRMKQSEHFFVFWSPEFGADPNSPEVDAAMRVDIDDLLAKAEHFFETNVNTLGMAVLGQGQSMLDDYKMQIYLIYQSEWLATGSGYDDKIGALWVNPSTCQPVGSTIAHEIGHSFQYQVYADKVQKQGFENDYTHGFRYGFGPNGDGGCAYWEQCAQWQAQLDYPEEMFGYHVPVWKANAHRHFNHEWMRYASYWLQHDWVNRHGIDAYGRIWRESVAPEDPVETYTRLYNGSDMQKTYDELYDYAAHMVYYDIPGIREYAIPEVKGDYYTKLYKVADGKYQVGYESTPGTTGFNVIELQVPSVGSTVSVEVEAIVPGSALHKNDAGTMLDGDGNKVGKATNYNDNAIYGAPNTESGYRYGYVAIVNGVPQYSEMSKGANGVASYTVPQGTHELYFVIMGAPETYHRQWWNDNEADDEQWPYAITISGTDVTKFEEVIEVVIDPDAQPQNVTLTVNVRGNEDSAYDYAHYNIAYLENAAICYAFALTPEQLDAAMQHSSEGLAEGKVVMRLKMTDGTYSYDDNCGGELGGFWCNAEGNPQGWGENARTYTKLHTIFDMEVGFMPGTLTAGETYPEVVELVYTKDGNEYVATMNFNFIVE